MWLISDEVYDTQVWEGAHLSPRALDGMAEHTLVVGSMSKSHAMTGSRCGWIVGPVDAIEHLTNLATHTTYGVPGYIQDAALFALNQGTGFETEIAAPFQRRRLLAQDILARQNAVSLVPAQGAMYLMLDVRSTGMSGEDFAYALLEKHHIAVMPGGKLRDGRGRPYPRRDDHRGHALCPSAGDGMRLRGKPRRLTKASRDHSYQQTKKAGGSSSGLFDWHILISCREHRYATPSADTPPVVSVSA